MGPLVEVTIYCNNLTDKVHGIHIFVFEETTDKSAANETKTELHKEQTE